MSFHPWEKPLGILPPGQYELDPTHPINQDGPPLGAWYAANLPGGPTLVDLSRNGNHGSLQGDVSWVAGPDGPVLDIPGDDPHYIEVLDAPSLDVDSLTVFAIAYLRSAGTEDIISRWWRADSTRQAFTLQILSGDLRLAARNEADDIFATSAMTIAKNEWVSIAGVYRAGDVLEHYLDGALADSASVTGALNKVDSPLHFGGRPNDSLSVSRWDGQIGMALYFGRALPAADIRTLHADPYALLRPVRRWWAVALEVGITHPVIGSGIVNSQATIGGQP